MLEGIKNLFLHARVVAFMYRFALNLSLAFQLVLCNLVLSQAFAQSPDATHASALQWHTSLESAQAESRKTGKPILMEIHGRPWCPPCVAQGKQIIDTTEFVQWASESVVVLEVQVGSGYDPKKGNPIWAEQFKKYKLPGIPAAVLLDESLSHVGTVYPKANAQQWLGAASNILTTHALKKQVAVSTPRSVNFLLTASNNISVPATLNGRFALNMMFHTAAGSVALTKEATARFGALEFNGQVDAKSWGGSLTMRSGTAVLAIGGLEARMVPIFEDTHSGRGTDGKFGPAQFETRLFGIDYQQQRIDLYNAMPRSVTREDSSWQQLDLHVESDMMFVTGRLFADDQVAARRFMIHSGYSGLALLDDAFVAETEFLQELPIEKQSELSDSAGNKLSTKLVRIAKLQVGQESLSTVPVSFFSGALGKQKYSVLGGDFLKRFNWVFDLDNQRAYFKRNSLYDAEYFSK
ncbi:MAG: hypothetical protein Aurels2KO_40660 [Aureliella sp.]